MAFLVAPVVVGGLAAATKAAKSYVDSKVENFKEFGTTICTNWEAKLWPTFRYLYFNPAFNIKNRIGRDLWIPDGVRRGIHNVSDLLQDEFERELKYFAQGRDAPAIHVAVDTDDGPWHTGLGARLGVVDRIGLAVKQLIESVDSARKLHDLLLYNYMPYDQVAWQRLYQPSAVQRRDPLASTRSACDPPAST